MVAPGWETGAGRILHTWDRDGTRKCRAPDKTKAPLLRAGLAVPTGFEPVFWP